MSENGHKNKIIELPISITVRELAQTMEASPIEVLHRHHARLPASHSWLGCLSALSPFLGSLVQFA